MAEILWLTVPNMDVVLNIFKKSDCNITDVRTFCIKYPSNIIIGHLNINSNRNKFKLLSFLIGDKADILLMSETKIEGTLLTSQFLTSGYSNEYWLDLNDKRGGIMLSV